MSGERHMIPDVRFESLEETHKEYTIKIGNRIHARGIREADVVLKELRKLIEDGIDPDMIQVFRVAKAIMQFSVDYTEIIEIEDECNDG